MTWESATNNLIQRWGDR